MKNIWSIRIIVLPLQQIFKQHLLTIQFTLFYYEEDFDFTFTLCNRNGIKRTIV